jgi:hypothetical protein
MPAAPRWSARGWHARRVGGTRRGPRPVGPGRPSCRSWTPAGGPEAKLARCAGSPSAIHINLAPSHAVCGWPPSRSPTTPARSAGRRRWASSPGHGALSRSSWTWTAGTPRGYSQAIELSHQAGRSSVRTRPLPEGCPPACVVERPTALPTFTIAGMHTRVRLPRSTQWSRWRSRHRAKGQSAGAA